MNHIVRKTVITGLALTMLVGGAGAAFADGKGKGNGKGKNGNEWRQVVETKFKPQKVSGKQSFQLNNYGTINISFSDLKGGDVEWAARYIASLASKNVFQGYEDGTFKPNQTISRVEAITAAVRLMGLEEQAKSSEAMNASLNFKDADKLKKNYSWATGYISVALANDLFAETDDRIHPDQPADRLWATTLLVKALKLQDQAKAKMNTKLSFKDADKIPAGSVGYVAVALEKNLITGYENNTFRPNQPVTRAEMAALLDRTGNQLPDHASIRGTVTTNVYNSNKLTLNVQGTTVTIDIDPNAFIYRNGAKVAASAIAAGDEVLVRTYGDKAIFIEVTKLASEQEKVDFAVLGLLNAFTLNDRGAIATVSIDQYVNGSLQTAVYNVSGSLKIEGDLSLLSKGRSIELKGSHGVVHTIIIK